MMNSILLSRSLPATRSLPAVLAVLLVSGVEAVTAAEPPSASSNTPLAFPQNVSVRHELEHAIERGLLWLSTNQNANGWWSTPDQPALTALALSAWQGQPKNRERADSTPGIRRGYEYLLSCVQPNGSIHRSNLVTYNTALSMMALVAARRPEHEPVLRKARQFLVGLQRDFGVKGQTDDVFDGGIGYGSRYEHSDMGNTSAALEALHYTKYLIADRPLADSTDLNWGAAVAFLQNCQNLPGRNQQPWASGEPKNKGGFIYYPGHSMAGGETNATTGRVALRSYGSISYAGLLSYIHADLKRDDPRVVAVFDWLRSNYTLTENPGMGPQGLYYYFHTMTKALSAYGARELELANGQKVDWRRELALRLINLQQRDGSWSNENGRWWEKDPALVTSYAVLSLELIQAGL
jgi:squalene-hopene/tetraprenyl-beta-curcumene cyclase